MNHIILIGRLTRDPELRYTPNGVAVTNFDLAVERDYKQEGQPDADFIRTIAWQKTAELCANYLKKGRLVAIEGRLQIRSYETKDGQKRTVAEVVANHVQFLERGEKNESNSKPVQSDPLAGIDINDIPF